jgi:chromosome partitioning protein
LRVIAILARKGGVAKSTLCRSLAVAALIDGRRAAIIDTDPQGSCLAWARRREADMPAVEGTDQPLADKLLQLRNRGAEIVLIDTPPSLQPVINLAAHQADLCLIASGIGPEDVEAVGGTAEIVKNLRKPGAIILTRCPPRAQAVSLAKAVLTAFKLPVCPTTLTQLVSHQYASAEGQTAQEMEPHGKAAREVTALWNWLKSQGWLADEPAAGRRAGE